VNSLFTLGLMIGISVHDTTLRTTIANLGMTDVNFPAPVFHGDSIHVVTTVEAVRASGSRPDAGLVTFRHRAFNQNNQEVANCTRVAFMRKRPAEKAK
jgi:acyl dehydratase